MKNKGLENAMASAFCAIADIPTIKYGIEFSKDILRDFDKYDSIGKMDSLLFTGIAATGAITFTLGAIYFGKKAYNYFFNKPQQ